MNAGRPALHTTVLDTEGLLRLFSTLAGRTCLGAVDGFGCVELVFTDPDEQGGGNLVSIFTEGGQRGRIAHGFVQDPEGYVERCGWQT